MPGSDLFSALPAEIDAALIARVGERATITSSAGAIEVGLELSSEAIDDLMERLLPADAMQTLKASGTVQLTLEPPSIPGEFRILAARTPGDSWMEMRCVKPAAGAPIPASAYETPAAEEAPPAPETDVETSGPEGLPGDDLFLPDNFEFPIRESVDLDDMAVPAIIGDAGADHMPLVEPLLARRSERSHSGTFLAETIAAVRPKARAHWRVVVPAAMVSLGIVLFLGGVFVGSRTGTPAPERALAVERPRAAATGQGLPLKPAPAVVQVVAKTAATPRPPVEPAVVASSAPPNDAPLPALAGRFAIQVAAVRQRTEADRITHDLMEQGYSAYVVNGNGTAAGLYRVRIGAFPDHRAAETVAKQVEETNGTGALWIVNDAIR